MDVPEGWTASKLGHLISEPTGGVSVLSYDRRATAGECAVLKTSAVSYGTFDADAHKVVAPSDLARVRESVKADHIIFSRMNTQALAGASVYVKDAYPDLYLPDRLWQFTSVDSEKIQTRWLAHVMASPSVRDRLSASATGTSESMKNISKEKLTALEILIPPLPEQRKIAAILSSVDEAIEKTQAVIDQVQVVKKGLMQELLTKGLPGRHQKFKQTEVGTIPESWEVIRFGEAFRRVRNPVEVQPATLYREIGIRSHAKGIFHKEPVAGATLGNKQVFWIVPGALIINIVFAWERAVAVTSEGENGMICSHRFPMYVPDSSMDVKFAALYFQESAGAAMLEAISPGGAGRNRTLNQGKLLDLPCPRPSLAEQMQIAETVVAIEQRLVADHRALDQLRTLKSALMQSLLTGQIRVTP